MLSWIEEYKTCRKDNLVWPEICFLGGMIRIII